MYVNIQNVSQSDLLIMLYCLYVGKKKQQICINRTAEEMTIKGTLGSGGVMLRRVTGQNWTQVAAVGIWGTPEKQEC